MQKSHSRCGLADVANANMLIRSCASMNWTTFLVALCETRQAQGASPEERAAFARTVQRVQQAGPCGTGGDARARNRQKIVRPVGCSCTWLWHLVARWLALANSAF